MKQVPVYGCAGLLCMALLAASCKHEIPLAANAGNATPTESITCSTDTFYFQQQVLPIFVSNCTQSGCHDVQTHKEGLVLNSYEGIMASGKIRPGLPGSSDLYKKIVDPNVNDRMPPLPYEALTAAQKNAIYTWIAQGAKNNSCSNRCDSSLFTYRTAVQPLLSGYCLGCHSGTTPQGGIGLSTYELVKARVDDGRLWGSLSHATGFFPMPKNAAPLSACQLNQVRKWIDAGAQNN